MSGPGNYTQNFDTLPNATTTAWTNDSTLSGWYAEKSLPVDAPTVVNILGNSGASNSGALYSFGSASTTERALGSLGSGTPGNLAYGVLLQNTSSGPLLINSIAYTGEQWRNGGNMSVQPLAFSYNQSPSPFTALTPGTPLPSGWTAVTSLDFMTRTNTAAAAALDGNLAANRTALTNSPNIPVPAGEYILLRWLDVNDAGSDHGVSLDDLTVSWIVPTTPSLTVTASPTSFVENAGATASTGTVSIPAAIGSNLSVTLSSNLVSRATVPASVTIPAGQLSTNFPITAVNDLLANGTQSVTILASATGYVQDQQVITVQNDSDTAIVVAITPDTFLESAGAGVATGSVTLAAPTVAALDVELVSLDETEATLTPDFVTIPAGGTTASFTVNAINDTDVDLNVSVIIRAIAPGYTTGEKTIIVQDDGDSPPPATLPVNAIAFTGYSGLSNDFLAFVALVPIAAGDQILFTDNEWNGLPLGTTGKFFDRNEGTLTWTAPAGGVAVGGVVNLSDLSSIAPVASVGTVVVTDGGFNLSTSDVESVYAFQGAELKPSRILAAVSAGLSVVPAESFVGTELTDWVILPTGINIAAYNGTRSTAASFAAYLPLIFDESANWITQENNFGDFNDMIAPDAPFNAAPFTISGGGNTYAAWSTTNSAAGGINGDHDNDGVKNAVEFFMGATGSTFTSNPSLDATRKVTFPKSTTATGVTGTIQTSPDLVVWTNVTADASVAGFISYTLPPSAPGGKLFLRLDVVVAP